MSVDDESRSNLSLFEPDSQPDASPRRRARRAARPDVQLRRARRRRLRGRIVPLIAVAIIVVVVASGYTIVRHFLDGFATKNYQGSGSGSVVVHIADGSSTREIAALLLKDDVIASTKAFVDAAGSKQFQAGYFKMRKQMSGDSAVALLLLPSTRLSTKVTIPEGFTERAILARLSTQLKLPLASLQKAAARVNQLGIPAGFTPSRTSAEGFLFPSTYVYPPSPSAADALVSMTGEFGQTVRALNFVAAAKRLRLTPYQVLIIASLVEAEAKFPADRAKVARVVYNRLAAKMPLGFDSTSAYGARLVGKDPVHINYNTPAPYNTRHTLGLPPTPIDNPGSASMRAAISPAKGNWKYFVSADEAGHLFFTNDAKAFDRASVRCKAAHWGCT
jgi:UPF0755 protein